MIDYEKELNDAQREAVLYDDGPALVIAGAGSGKTRVLTYKLAHLIEEGYQPWKLMALTFTNKAANEMKHRVEALVGGSAARQMLVGTFHSVFARILRSFAHLLGYDRGFTIYDTSDSKALIKSILKDLKLDPKTYSPNVVLAIISDAKNRLLSPQAYAQETIRRQMDDFNGIPRLSELYSIYAAHCKQANAMDFDDLLYQFNVLLRNFPEALLACQNAVDYLLIDEYQDTNAAQYNIAKKLVETKERVFVVGDDAQSIYSFRGADIQNILSFTRGFPCAKIFKLEQNYRSSQNIVNLANRLIEKNRLGIPKTLYSHREKGDKIALREYETGRTEAAETVVDLYKRVQLFSHLTYSSFAILYRTNAQSRLFEEQLRKFNIPYRIYGGMAFYSRAEVKNILSYFRIIVNPHDNEAFSRTLDYPKKGIGDKTQTEISALAAANGISLFTAAKLVANDDTLLKTGPRRKLLAYLETVGELRAIKATSFVERTQRLLQLSGIEEDLSRDTTVEGKARVENMKEFLNGVREFEMAYLSDEQALPEGSLFSSVDMMAAFVESVSLITSQESDRKDEEKDRVTLLTIHAAKGLEFDEVYITGLEEGIFPSIRSFAAADLEEERRLFYVAITRARSRCNISLARARMRNGITDYMMPSSFLKELDKSLVDFESKRLAWELPSIPWVKGEPSEGGDILPGDPYVFSSKDSQAPSAALPSLPKETTQRFNSERFEKKKGKVRKSTQIPKLKTGNRIRHAIFGEGTVQRLDGEEESQKAEIFFDDGSIRTLVLRFSKLSILS